ALGLVGLAAMVLAVPPIDGLPLPGYAAIALLLLAAIVAMPSLVRCLLRYAPRLPGVTGQLAMAQIWGAARYATLSIAAIIVSFSLMVSMAIMVTSFRQSLDSWTQKLLPADVYVRAGYVGQTSYLDDHSARQIAQLPGVERVEF